MNSRIAKENQRSRRLIMLLLTASMVYLIGASGDTAENANRGKSPSATVAGNHLKRPPRRAPDKSGRVIPTLQKSAVTTWAHPAERLPQSYVGPAKRVSSPPIDTPCIGVAVSPDQDLRAVVGQNREGTTFCLAAGTYRLSAPLQPKTGQQFVAVHRRKAVLSGARLIASSQISRVGSRWVISGQTQQTPIAQTKCYPAGYEGCRYAEGVFLDNTPLRQVLSLGELSAGKFYFDYPRDRIFLAQNPSGHKLETTRGNHAFMNGGDLVALRGLVIEKFSTPYQTGAAITVASRSDWLIEDNEVRLNGSGIAVQGTRTVVRGNWVHDQMQIGITGYQEAFGVVMENEISYNNVGGFQWQGEAGGTKFVKTKNLLLYANDVHHNMGPGLWADYENIDTHYESNRVDANVGVGIFHEVSYQALIRGNVVTGTRPAAAASTYRDWSGYGILISNSPDVEVAGNDVDSNATGGIVGIQYDREKAAAYGPLQVKNLNVHDNIIRLGESKMVGILQYVGDNSYFTGRGNRFSNNTYYLQNAVAGKHFRWNNNSITLAQWRQAGNDSTATL